jgi:hypothetical protein
VCVCVCVCVCDTLKKVSESSNFQQIVFTE